MIKTFLSRSGSSTEETTPAQFFDHLAHTFEIARRQHPVEDLLIQTGDDITRIRCSTPLLRQRIFRPLACQILPNSDIPADFHVDLVDLGKEPLPALPWPPHQVSAEQETAEVKYTPFVFTRHGDSVLTGLNYDEHRTIGLVHNPANWPTRHYKQSIFITLYQHLRWRGLYLIHASAIASNGRVALVAGYAGAGKTTTMLSCVKAGFGFLGDDATLVRRAPDGGAEVIALLSTLEVTDKTAGWYPELEPYLSTERNHNGKRQVVLPEVYPHSLMHRGQVALMLVPQVVDQERTSVETANKASLLSDLLLNSLDLHDTTLAKAHLDFLAELLETLPSYRLLLGRDRERIPDLLRELLAQNS